MPLNLSLAFFSNCDRCCKSFSFAQLRANCYPRPRWKRSWTTAILRPTMLGRCAKKSLLDLHALQHRLICRLELGEFRLRRHEDHEDDGTVVLWDSNQPIP